MDPEPGIELVILRAPGIYAAERLPLERLRARTPVLRVEDDVYTSHVHAEDLAAIVSRALEHDAPAGVYNAADDTEMKMGDWFDLVADALRAAAAAPGFEVASRKRHFLQLALLHE